MFIVSRVFRFFSLFVVCISQQLVEVVYLREFDSTIDFRIWLYKKPQQQKTLLKTDEALFLLKFVWIFTQWALFRSVSLVPQRTRSRPIWVQYNHFSFLILLQSHMSAALLALTQCVRTSFFRSSAFRFPDQISIFNANVWMFWLYSLNVFSFFSPH